ncbi:ATP phosphoribosyltransferase regulatory subunit [Ruminococcaceae bacterium OttesenSCG-928-L11]|nr:ATP phosphoribosyltransferase regulatory subunit [Ruminococcaceae bacterium OttesenSCG-928-L11]
MNHIRNPKKDELVTAGLRQLFEMRGFVQARVNKFEEYELYIDNKRFLDSERIITFMDMDGKLLALKPDVTLSIVKNVSAKPLNRFEKLYYIDEVCRVSRESREYKMLSQVGVELIGPQDPFVSLEILDLALESLALISDDFVLDLSHQGFVSGLLDTVDTDYSTRERLVEALHSKSPHTVATILDDAGINGDVKQRFCALAALSGNITAALPEAEALIASPPMREAWEELDKLGAMLRACGMDERVNLDFSVVNDLDYYNGLIFIGYVKGVPDVVLTGGRYDNLMTKMGKHNGAIGFAVFLSQLNTYFKSGKTYDFDVLLQYDADCDYAELLAQVRRFTADGKSVRLEQVGGKPACICLEAWRFGPDGLRKEAL